MRQAAVTLFAFLVLAANLRAQEPPPSVVAETHQTAPHEQGLFGKLVTTIVRDVKRLPSKEIRPLLFHGAAFTLAAYPLDEIATLGASSSKVLKAGFAGAGKALGREWVQGGGALAAYVAGHALKNAHLVEASGDLIEAQLVSAAVTQATKFVVGRTRPDGEARSFPSGHASAAFATAATLQRHYGRKIGIPAYAVAVYTSASRLQANSHYPSDVIAGAALGIAVAHTATIRVGSQRLQVTPTPVSRGVAVVVTALRD
jgi:membrane-associated phospholipid phosphatase